MYGKMSKMRERSYFISGRADRRCDKHQKRGCLFGIGRLILIICTCGLWLLFGRKKYRSKTSFSNQKVAICQNCGHSWSA